jgi:hypothetical protein
MLKPATTYYARVKAIGDSESEYSRTIAVTTLSNNLNTPPTLAPTAPVIYTTTITANYISLILEEPETNQQVSEYKVTLSTLNDFSNTILNSYVYPVDSLGSSIKEGASYLSLPLANLIPATVYYIKISASNSVGLSSNTTVSFTTLNSVNAPELIGATSLTSISAVVEWYPVANAVNYRLDVSAFSNFSSLVVNNLLVTGTSYNIVALTEETTYYYRVRSNNGSTLSNNSTTLSFSTLNGAATYTGIAVNLSSIRGLSTYNLESSLFSIKWDSVENAINYRLQVSTTSNFSTTIVNTLSADTSSVVSGLTEGVVYFYRVRAENNYTVSTYISGAITTLTVDNNLIPSSLLAVSNRFSTGFIQNWSKRSYATNYIIEISLTNLFTSILQTFYTRDIDTLPIDGLVPNTTYYVRIKGANTNYISSYSTVLSVITKTTLPVILPVASIGSYQVTVSWNTSIIYTSYSVSLYKELDGSLVSVSPLYLNRDIGNVSSYLFDLYIEPATSYQVVVSGLTSDGDKKDSNFLSFTSSNGAPYLQFDPITASITWKGQANRLNISSSSSFVYTVPDYTDRVIDSSIKTISIREELSKGSHLFIQSYFQGTTKGDISNVLYTLNYHPVILEPQITSNSIEINWMQGLSSSYRIKVEQLSAGDYIPVVGYLLPKDIGNNTSHLIANLTQSTTYKITIQYKNEAGKFVAINTPLIYRTYLVNSSAFPVVGTISSPSSTVSNLEYDRVTLSLDNINSDLIGYSISQDNTSPRKIKFYETVGSKINLTRLKADTTYYVKLWRIISSTRSVEQVISFTTLPFSYSTTSNLTAPIIQNIVLLNSSEVRINWTNVGGYTIKVEIADDINFSVLNTSVYITYYTNYAVVSGLLNTQTYKARIYLYNNKVISPYSSSVNIQTV